MDKNTHTIDRVQWFDDRFYKIEKEGVVRYVPSVTTKLGVIAKPFLAKWRGDIGNREADMRMFEAAERGTRIHNAWSVLTTGGTVLYQPWDRPNFAPEHLAKIFEEKGGNVAVLQYQDEMYQVFKLQKWIAAVNPKIIASEITVYDLANNDAGTADNVIEVNGGSYLVSGAKPITIMPGKYVVDLKTGSTVDEDAFQQTAAYAGCLLSMGQTGIVGTIIIHTGSKNKGGIEGLGTLVRDREQWPKDYENYRLVSKVWEMKNQGASPKVFDLPTMISLAK